MREKFLFSCYLWSLDLLATLPGHAFHSTQHVLVALCIDQNLLLSNLSLEQALNLDPCHHLSAQPSQWLWVYDGKVTWWSGIVLAHLPVPAAPVEDGATYGCSRF